MSKQALGVPLVDVAGACCPPLTREPLSPDQADTLAPALKALADPVRLRLLSMIASHRDGEACVCQLTEAFDVSGPTISHHLKVLREAGLIDGERRGTWVYYRARPDTLQQLCYLLTPNADAAMPCSATA
jgi:ArsR family transcriptional regulator, arsenate/arsenite/antimonite-responsive transcriptional repressor